MCLWYANGHWSGVNDSSCLRILVQDFIYLLFFGIFDLVGGSGVSLLGVSFKGLYAVCLLWVFTFFFVVVKC